MTHDDAAELSEAWLRQQERRLTFRIGLADRLRDLAGPAEIIAAACEAVGRHLGVARTGYAEVDAADALHPVERDWTDGTLASLAGRARALHGIGPEALAELRAGRTLRLDDVALDPRTNSPDRLAALDGIGARAVLVAPLLKGGRFTAVFYLHRSTAHRWTDAEVSVAEDAAERTWATVARARAEVALRASEGRLQAVFDTVPFGIVIAEAPSGRVLMGNPQTERILRHPIYPTPDLAAYPEWKVFHPDGRRVEPKDYPIARAVLEGKATPEEEYLYQRGDGSMAWMRLAAAPIRDASGAVVAGAVAIVDIDREKRTEAALRRLNETLEQRVAEQARERDRSWRLSQDLILVAGLDATIVAVNPAWTAQLGWTEGDLLGMSFLDLVHPDDLAGTLAEVERLSRGLITSRFENRYRCKNGDYRWISWTAAPDETLVHGIGRDVSDEKAAREALHRAEEQLHQAQKMEAVGQLTGGIAHDFNNLLQAMASSIEVIGRRIAAGQHDVEPFLRTARLSIERAASLTQRLLAFSRRQPLQPEAVDLNALVTGMEDLVCRTVGVGARVEIRLAEGLGRAWADANQVESALLNLVINARDAMPDGGRITIETGNTRLEARDAPPESGLEPGDYVTLAVADTGTGMTPEVLARAFEPFFTTKPLGQGTGLGLSQLYGFARQSGGHVRIDSEVGRGTVVGLHLPRHRGPETAPAESAAIPPPCLDGGCVLLVEDEPLIRAMLAEALRDEGYEVSEAAEGRAALAVLESGASVDLLVTDVGLPGLNGRQVAEMARSLRPGLKVLFLTGYAHNAGIGEEALGPGTQLLNKPVALDTLLAKVGSMLSEDDPLRKA